jgi:hypothetical protein
MSQDPPTYTDREAIIDVLTDATVGDEFTLEADNGYKDNREVTDAEETYLTFGDVDSDQCRLLHRARGTLHEVPEDAWRGVSSSGWPITRLIVRN